MTRTIRILGLDPGLQRTGWGVIACAGSRLSAIAWGVAATDPAAPIPQRLCAIHRAVGAVLAQHRPDEASVEDQFVHVNPAIALKLGQARAAAVLAPALAGLPVAEYAPKTIKSAVVGVGSADKTQIAAMIAVLLPGAKADADAADALAAAVCHAHHRARPALRAAS